MAVVALMEQELVRKRRLLGLEEFLHGVGLGQVLGSFAVNAAAFSGYRLAGGAGALVAAVSFLAPSVGLVTVLSALYFRYHAVPALADAVGGLGPVVVALIVAAAWNIGRRVLRSPAAWAIFAGSLVAGLLRWNPAWTLLAAGVAGLLMRDGGGTSNSMAEKGAGAARAGGGAWMALPAGAAAEAGLGKLTAVFLQIGLVFFGGGFVLLPVLHDRLVTRLGWLSPREFVDGVAISQLTPGPIAVLATFAGYHEGGVAGALVATAALFAPGLLFMLFLCSQYERRRDQPWARRFLAGVNPAVAGMVLAAAVALGRGGLGGWAHWLAACAAFVLLVFTRVHPAPLLAMAGLAGWLGWLR